MKTGTHTQVPVPMTIPENSPPMFFLNAMMMPMRTEPNLFELYRVQPILAIQ